MCLDFCWKRKKFKPTYVSSRSKHRLSSVKKGSKAFKRVSRMPGKVHVESQQRCIVNASSESEQKVAGERASLNMQGNTVFHRNPSKGTMHRERVSDVNPPPPQAARHREHVSDISIPPPKAARHRECVSDITPPPPKHRDRVSDISIPPPTVAVHQDHVSDIISKGAMHRDHVSDISKGAMYRDHVSDISKGAMHRDRVSDIIVPPPPPRRTSSMKPRTSIPKAPISTIPSSPVYTMTTSQEMCLSTGQLQPKEMKGLAQWYRVHGGKSYPTPMEKRALARQLGITVEQVSLWFSNLRKSTRNPQSNVKRVLII